MAKVRTHTFRGRRYEIIHGDDVEGFVRVEGGPDVLFIQSGLSPRAKLEAYIHEALHAEEPRMREDRVDRIARSLARWLWRLGYRQTL